MDASVAEVSGWVDPRILRTRRMLMDGLEHLLETKSIEQTSVGEIAEKAGLNRATFYDHYPDKFSLLEGLVELRFEEMLRSRGVIFDGTCAYAVAAIIRVTCDYLVGLPGTGCPARRQMEKHLETAVISVVRGMMLVGLRSKHHTVEPSAEMVAAMIAGAIYGGAGEWVRMAERPAVEAAVTSIFKLVSPMLHAAEGD